MDASTHFCQKIFFECKRAQESCCTIYSGALSKWQLAEKLQESALWKVDLAPLVQFEFRFLPPFSWHSLQGIGIEFWLAWISGHSFVSNSICLQSNSELWNSLHKNAWLWLRFENANLGWMQLLTLSSWPNWASIFRLFQQGYQKHWHRKIWGRQ